MIYYNDNDAKCCAWLRELITAKLIVEGEVDETSITEVIPARLEKAHQAHFFAGIGGWAHALRLAGWPEGREVWTGSCPCQSFSVAGKRKGVKDARHLWPAWFRIIRQRRPATIFGEQVEGAIGHGWLDAVFADLEGEGYACGAAVLGAHSVGAPHRRQRIFWVADAGRQCHEFRRESGKLVGQGGNVKAQDLGSEGRDDPAWQRKRSGHADTDRMSVGSVGNSEGRVRKVPVCARGSRQAMPESGGTGGSGGLAHAKSERCDVVQSASRAECSAGVPAQKRRTKFGDMGTAFGSVADDDGKKQKRAAAKGAAGGLNKGRLVGHGGETFWSGGEWISCKDGKFRAVEPGIFPLALGVSRGVVPSGDPGESYANEVGEARGMRLKGYGNAIVPQLAALFVRAFLEAEND